MNILLFARYLADFSIFFPVALLCLAPVRSHMKFPKRSPLIALGIAAVFWLAFSLFGVVLGANSNALLWWQCFWHSSYIGVRSAPLFPSVGPHSLLQPPPW